MIVGVGSGSDVDSTLCIGARMVVDVKYDDVERCDNVVVLYGSSFDSVSVSVIVCC